MQALEVDLGQTEQARAQAQWLASHRGRAYVEIECGHCLQALNVSDSHATVEAPAAPSKDAAGQAAQPRASSRG